MQGDLRDFMLNMQSLHQVGLMPWHVSYHDRLDFLNARVEEFVADNPGKRAPWFEQVQAVFEATGRWPYTHAR